MSTNVPEAPFSAFLDRSGNAIEGGKIYVGDKGLDPISSPKRIFWDKALTQAAAQPIRTAGGMAMRRGKPAQFWCDGDYSIAVYTRDNVLAYSENIDVAAASTPSTNYITTADATVTSLDVSGIEVVFCDTSSNSVTVEGLVGGEIGQTIELVKSSASNSLTFSHNASTGNQDLFLYGSKSVTLDATTAVSGGSSFVWDGSFWRELTRDPSAIAKQALEMAAGTYSGLDVQGVELVACEGGSPARIRGLTNGIVGQRVAFFKREIAGTVAWQDNFGTANQDLRNLNAADWAINQALGRDWGGVMYVFEGTDWYEFARSS